MEYPNIPAEHSVLAQRSTSGSDCSSAEDAGPNAAHAATSTWPLAASAKRGARRGCYNERGRACTSHRVPAEQLSHDSPAAILAGERPDPARPVTPPRSLRRKWMLANLRAR